jgi:hypothetical protein
VSSTTASPGIVVVWMPAVAEAARIQHSTTMTAHSRHVIRMAAALVGNRPEGKATAGMSGTSGNTDEQSGISIGKCQSCSPYYLSDTLPNALSICHIYSDSLWWDSLRSLTCKVPYWP